MPCYSVSTPAGRAIVCTGRRRLPRCACGKPAEQLCDWKLGEGKTCSRPVCLRCTVSPAPGKDLCPEHGLAWAEWKEARRPREASAG